MSKEVLKNTLMGKMDEVASQFDHAKPKRVFVATELAEGITFTATRAEFSPGLLLNIYAEDGHEVAQMEVRPTAENVWDIADRQVEKEYRGNGIFAALLNASHTFIEHMANRRKTPQHMEATIGQPNVFQNFERRKEIGLTVRKGDEAAAELLRLSSAPPGMTLMNDWVKERKGNGWLQTTKRDPFLYRNETLSTNPHPENKDAIRATLEKTVHPSAAVVSGNVETFRGRTQTLL